MNITACIQSWPLYSNGLSLRRHRYLEMANPNRAVYIREVHTMRSGREDIERSGIFHILLHTLCFNEDNVAKIV